ncbi:hypothetical protein [Pseudomonas sp.]|uniref:hypothetical protein n=1 Tax=Pseudomonas sp. TaxID=306 RepID=UPI00260B6555|nr:hypothetical protein [Pseudomonas sp.]
MKVWRVMLLALSFLLLNGCLVTFTQAPLEPHKAPKTLLGQWVSQDAWGQARHLNIRAIDKTRYQAEVYPKGELKARKRYTFIVARHGNRWYASAAMPAAQGGNYTLNGFEVTPTGELVVYDLDLEQVRQAIGQSALTGEPVETAEGTGVQIDSPSAKVFAYLDDPANSDVFVEIARYQRVAK